MGDNYSKLSAGAPITAFSRTVYNDTIDMLRWWRIAVNSGRGPADGIPIPPSNLITIVRNDSGSDLERFAVLGIRDPIYTRDDNQVEFDNKPSWAGTVPTLTGDTPSTSYVVTLEPLGSGKIGRAVLAGLVPVQLYFDSDALIYKFADAHDGDTTYLYPGVSGRAEILWSETPASYPGSAWALVLLGSGFCDEIVALTLAEPLLACSSAAALLLDCNGQAIVSAGSAGSGSGATGYTVYDPWGMVKTELLALVDEAGNYYLDTGTPILARRSASCNRLEFFRAGHACGYGSGSGSGSGSGEVCVTPASMGYPALPVADGDYVPVFRRIGSTQCFVQWIAMADCATSGSGSGSGSGV